MSVALSAEQECVFLLVQGHAELRLGGGCEEAAALRADVAQVKQMAQGLERAAATGGGGEAGAADEGRAS